MEEHPHIIEKVQVYIQPNSLCKDRAEYISRAAMNVGEKLNLLDTWSHNTDDSPANVLISICALRVWLNIEVNSLNNVRMLLHYGLNFESFIWA